MSYRLAKIYLRDAFPGGKELPASSIKRNVGAIGQRLEREANQATGAVAFSFRRANRLPLTGPPLALQVDAGYIKTRPQADGKRWIPVVASKLVRSSPGRGYAHACALGLGRRHGMRQQAFLQSIGVDRQPPITVLSDGGDDISHACKLPAATARVLDWFHIGMRFEQLCSHCEVYPGRTRTRSPGSTPMWSRQSRCSGMVARNVASRRSKR